MKTISKSRTLPVVYTIREKFQRNGRLLVVELNRNVTVQLTASLSSVEIQDYPTVRSNRRNGMRLHWECKRSEFMTLYSLGKASKLQEAFRNYVLAWYCRTGENVVF